MGRSPCCSKVGMNRGAWTALEDKILTDYIKAHGEGRWRNLPQKSGLKRCGKSCRLRWLNYLRPDIKRGNISLDEEDLIIRLHKLLGNKWSLIAGRLPGRTDNEIKNYWNTNLVKKVQDHQNSSSDHSNHNHHSNGKTKKKPMIIEPPPPPNIQPPPPFFHTKPAITTTTTTTTTNIIISPVPEKVDHVPMLRDNISVDDLVDYGSSYNNNGLSSLDGGGEDAVPENFMVDLTMGEGDVQLSDLLNNSEFSDFFYFNCIKNDNNVDDHINNPSSPWSLPPPSSDLVFSNEIPENWALCDQNVVSNLNSLSSFLDTEEGDWLYV